MKIYLNAPKESWIVDRFVKEWKYHNKTISTRFITNSDIIWIISPWTWRNLSIKQLKDKKVICTIHHLDPAKFDQNDFEELDQFVNIYHIITKKTEKFLRSLTEKEIFYSPFWVDSNKFYEIKDKSDIRSKNQLPKEDFIIGSFQRDTEGKDLVSPKLIKGPDRFVSIVKRLNIEKKDLTVLLAGKRRQYVISKLEEENIKYVYLEMVDFKTLNELYNTLDLYIVTSRIEGGPQSIVECGISKTPIISTDVGIASEILNKKSIFNMENFLNAEPNVETAYKNSMKLAIPRGFVKYSELFESLVIK